MFKWIKALRAGERLTHAKTWKQAQLSVNAVVALLTVALSYFDIGIKEEDIVAVATAVVVIVNIYLTKATSRKL